MRNYIKQIVALGSMVLMAEVAMAEIRLKVADSFPAGHYLAEGVVKPWMKEVTEATNGEIQFDYYPAQQLGKAKDLLSLVQTQVADIAFIVPSFVSEKMPLSPIAELPMDAATGCNGAMAYHRLLQTDSVIRKTDYDANGLHPLFVTYLPPYQIFTNRTIASISDLKGMKIRATGSAKSAVVESLGAIPVNISTPEVREAMSRGTVDGVLFVYSSLFPYDLAGLVKSATADANFGGWVSTYSISQKAWDKLSPQTQDAMDTLAEKYSRVSCELVMARDLRDRERLVKEVGANLIIPTDADRSILAEVTQDWTSTLDSLGHQGTEALNEFRAALDEN